jgi:hypothetical protein
VTAREYDAVPLMEFSIPYSDHQLEGAVFPGAPTLRHVASSEFKASLDALLPFEPSSHFWPGRSWDSPFRALLLPDIRRSFRIARAFLTLPTPDGGTLAVFTIGSGLLRGS